MTQFIKIILLVFVCFFAMLFSINQMVDIYFYFLLLYVLWDIVKKKQIELVHIWNGAFIYIILSEVMSPHYLFSDRTRSVVEYFIIANTLINIGYLLSSKEFQYREQLPEEEYTDIKHNSAYWGITVLIVLTIGYFVTNINYAVQSIVLGRINAFSIKDSNVVVNALLSSFALLGPSMFCYLYCIVLDNKIWKPLLLSTPIFAILIMQGTRYAILFSLLSAFLVYVYRHPKELISPQKVTLFLSLGILLYFLSNAMLNFRTTSKREIHASVVNGSLTERLSSYMSPEGVVYQTEKMFEYFETHDHLYGYSTASLIYVWIPRSIYPDKPTLLGHWLVREHSKVSQYHSVSYGFTGDLYADFGYYSLLGVFLVGIVLGYVNNIKKRLLHSKGYAMILGCMLYPYVFFFVRSPITATITFVGILIVFFSLKSVIFHSQKYSQQ